MSASKLVKPSVDFKDSFLEALAEFHEDNWYTHLDIEETREEFETFVDDLNEGRRYLHQPFPDWVEPVPETVLWLVKDDKYIGTFKVRHRLNWHLEKWGGHISFLIRPSMRGKGFGKKLLQKGMPYACYLGIDKALITINPKHTAGRAIVEFCGGVLQDETQETDQFPARLRYWLDCS